MTNVITRTFTIEYEEEIPIPDASNLVTEDDTPVDNLFSEREMDLLKGSAYDSWPGPGQGRTFIALANVAIYASPDTPPLVPDVLISLDVELPQDPWPKQNRSYMIWQYGKPPDIVVEVVSNRKGKEAGDKLLDYARLGIAYYIVFDPQRLLSDKLLRIFGRQGSSYVEIEETWFEDIGIGVTLWRGRFRGLAATWLRWCDRDGNILLTGEELAAQAHQRAEDEHRRAEEARQQAAEEHRRAEEARQRAAQEQQRAEEERQRAERLAEKLRALGIDPDA